MHSSWHCNCSFLCDMSKYSLPWFFILFTDAPLYGAASQPSSMTYSASSISGAGMYSNYEIWCDMTSQLILFGKIWHVFHLQEYQLLHREDWSVLQPPQRLPLSLQLIYLVSGHWKYLFTCVVVFRAPASLTVQMELWTSFCLWPTVVNRILRMIQSNVRNSVPGISMNPI